MADEMELLKEWIKTSKNIVFFGGAGVSTESNIPDFRSTDGLYNQADMLIVGGTSLTVYPAAGLIDYYRGNKLVLINMAATVRDGIADLIIKRKIGEALSEAVE